MVSNDFGNVESGVVEFKVFNLGPLNGIIGWWPFDGNASDMSGNAIHGTVHGATLASDRNGLKYGLRL